MWDWEKAWGLRLNAISEEDNNWLRKDSSLPHKIQTLLNFWSLICNLPIYIYMCVYIYIYIYMNIFVHFKIIYSFFSYSMVSAIFVCQTLLIILWILSKYWVQVFFFFMHVIYSLYTHMWCDFYLSIM